MNSIIPVEVKSNLGIITDNLDAVEASIREFCDQYKGLVVTVETLKADKALVADLRKRKTALDDERKKIKKEWNKPYDAFEKRVREILGLYDEPINAINAQAEAFEAMRKAEKRGVIAEIYKAFVATDPELAEWLPLERMYDTRWENATYSEKQIEADMRERRTKLDSDKNALKLIGNEMFLEDGLSVLKAGGSLQEAIVRVTGLQKQYEIAQQRLREEEERKAEEARKAAEAAQTPIEPIIEEPKEDVVPFAFEPFEATEEAVEPFRATEEEENEPIIVMVPGSRKDEFCNLMRAHGFAFVEGCYA